MTRRAANLQSDTRKAGAVLPAVDTNTRWLGMGGGGGEEEGGGASYPRDESMGLAIIFLACAPSYGRTWLA